MNSDERKRGQPANQTWITLRAGPLTIRLDPASGFLRYICLGNTLEILRGIYVAVRDPNWLTVAPAITDFHVKQETDAFGVTFTAECREGAIDFVWHGAITGSAAGEVRYAMEGVARSTFRRNRIGFCVLHPAACAGTRCIVETVDGGRRESRFPEYIAPHQPFRDVRSIKHEVGSRLWATVDFEGDTFETEDQRNWSDASFKTYSTPLALPFPVEVREGAEIRQAVTLRVEREVGGNGTGAWVHTAPAVRPAGREAIEWVSRPRIGLGIASHGQPLAPHEVERVRALGLDHLRVDLDFRVSDWRQTLARAAGDARAIDTSLHAALHLSDAAEAEMSELAAMLRQLGAPISVWLVFHQRSAATPTALVALAKRTLAPLAPGALVAAGTNAYFAELNRNRPPPGAADLVCFSLNPQVHAADEASIVETLEAQPQMVASARQFAGGAQIAVTPITLRPRFNPNATGPAVAPAPGELPPEVDPRQPSLFAEAWTLGSIASLAEAEPYAVTYYETTGWRGVMATQADSATTRPPTVTGGVFPMYHVFADIAEIGTRVAKFPTLEPLAVQGIVAHDGATRRWLVANLTRTSQRVNLPLEASKAWRFRQLDDSCVLHAMAAPEQWRATSWKPVSWQTFDLPPYAYLRVERVVEGGSM